MWLWILGGIVAIIILIVGYLWRVAKRRLKPEPIEGIPSPPPSHEMMGHVYEMLHPLRHELRLAICDRAAGGIHQLTMMKHVSIFINDCKEASRILFENKEKGPMIAAFRLDSKIPDLYTSDGEAWSIRHKAFTPSLVSSYTKAKNVTTDLIAYLQKQSETGETINILDVFTLYAFDIICKIIFQYDLNAINGSEEGKKLLLSLDTLATAQASTGYFPLKGVRKVSSDELTSAKLNWKQFLNKLISVITSDAEQFKSKHGALTPQTVFGHALITMKETNQEFTDEHIKSEIHQVLRHGYECIAGQLVWVFVALHRNHKIRKQLESELETYTTTSSSTSHPSSSLSPSLHSSSSLPYLEAVLKETLRRYPITGNATVRTVMEVDQNTGKALLLNKYPVPIGTLLHLHIWSMHNTTYIWDKPKDFEPDRWLEKPRVETVINQEDEEECEAEISRAPTEACHVSMKESEEGYTQYDGVGHIEGELSYFPFSTGARICPGRILSISIMRATVLDICSKFRLNPVTTHWEADPGNSASSTVLPADKRNIMLKVIQKGRDEEEEKEQDDGWAQDSDDEK